MVFNLPNIMIKPDLVTLFYRDFPLCTPLPLASGTPKYVWTHEFIGYPKMDISHWDAAIHYGIQLAQYSDKTRTFDATLRR